MSHSNLLGIPRSGGKDYATLHTPNGNGSTGVAIVTYAKHDNPGGYNLVHDPINGDYIQIIDNGLYVVFRQFKTSASGDFHGVSVNTSDTTMTINGIPTAEILLRFTTPSAGAASQTYTICGVFPLNAGDKLRSHDEAAGEEAGTLSYHRLTVARIA